MACYDWNLARELSPIGKGWAKVAQKKAYNILAKHLACPNKKLQVLEIGAGKGFFAEVCAEKGHDYEGIEGNEYAAKKLSEKGFSIIQSYVPPISFESEKFDLVYSSHVIEHLRDPKEAFEFVKEIHRVTKPEGIIVLLFPDFLRAGKEFWNLDYTHNFVTSRRRVKQLFDDCGITTLETVPQSGHIFGRVSYLISAILKLYPYSFLQKTFDFCIEPELFYRPRRALLEGILLVGKRNN